jgi:hypothetical protein
MFSSDGNAYNLDIDSTSGSYTWKRQCYSDGVTAFTDGSYYGNFSGYYAWILFESTSKTLYQYSYISTG